MYLYLYRLIAQNKTYMQPALLMFVEYSYMSTLEGIRKLFRDVCFDVLLTWMETVVHIYSCDIAFKIFLPEISQIDLFLAEL